MEVVAISQSSSELHYDDSHHGLPSHPGGGDPFSSSQTMRYKENSRIVSTRKCLRCQDAAIRIIRSEIVSEFRSFVVDLVFIFSGFTTRGDKKKRAEWRSLVVGRINMARRLSRGRVVMRA